MPNGKSKAKSKTTKPKRTPHRSANTILGGSSGTSSRRPLGIGLATYNVLRNKVAHRTGIATERLGTVTSVGITIPTGGFYEQSTLAMPVNPGVMLETKPTNFVPVPAPSRLAAISELFSEYVVRRLRIKYTPVTTVFNSGEIIITYDGNTYELPAPSDRIACQKVHALGTVYSTFTLVLDDLPKTRKYCRHSSLVGVDLKTYDMGKIRVYTNGILSSGAGSVYGHIDVEYEFDFYVPDDGRNGTASQESAPTQDSFTLAGNNVVVTGTGDAQLAGDVTTVTATGNFTPIGVKPNGGTTAQSLSQAFRVNESGIYNLTSLVEAETAIAETLLKSPTLSLYKSGSETSNPDGAVEFDKTLFGAWDNFSPGQNTVSGVVNWVGELVAGEVVRAKTILNEPGDYSILNTVLNFVKVADMVLGVAAAIPAEIAHKMSLPPKLPDRKTYLKHVLSKSYMNKPANMQAREEYQLELDDLEPPLHTVMEEVDCTYPQSEAESVNTATARPWAVTRYLKPH